MNTVLDVIPESDASSMIIRTTLYDLMETMQNGAESPDEELIVASVVHLLRSGRITFLRNSEALNTIRSEFARESYS